jgi:hypothetical protein
MVAVLAEQAMPAARNMGWMLSRANQKLGHHR